MSDEHRSRRVTASPLTAADVVELVTDVGPAPMNIGVALELSTVPLDAAELAAEVARRLATIPRLRQRLMIRGRGRRPSWVEDGQLDISRHVRVAAADPGEPDPVLTAAARMVASPLPQDRPLWAATVVTGAAGAALGVVVVMHHVVADGIGGLAVLAELVDPDPTAGPVPTASGLHRAARPAMTTSPGPREQADGRSLCPHLRAALLRVRGEIGRSPLAPRCTLNAPTGPRRNLAVVERDLAALSSTAHRHGATVNDALLVVVTGAMARLLVGRGQGRPPALVVSVPVSSRAMTTSTDLGNRVGAMLVRVPLDGSSGSRLDRTSRLTRARKTQARGPSASFLGPLFRVLAAAGAFRWFINRQRFVNSFLTNVHGPGAVRHLMGAPIRRIVPVTVTPGNVGVAFAAISYCGKLTIAVIADPDVVPEIDMLAAAVETELAMIAPGS